MEKRLDNIKKKQIALFGVTKGNLGPWVEKEDRMKDRK